MTGGSPRRRAGSLRATLAVTALGAVLPGAGLLYTGRRTLGLLVLLPTLAVLAYGAWTVARDPGTAVDLAFDPARLTLAATLVGLALVAWSAVVVTTYLLVRPRVRSRAHTAVGVALVVGLCTAVAAPAVLAVRYAGVQADLVEVLFEDNTTATAPRAVTAEDPWGGQSRVNVLLLGGDGGVDRTGVRTDSMILLSLDTRSGRAVSFSLPRNLQGAPFPDDSPLHTLYPGGFTGAGDPGNWMLNAVYKQVPELHPGILGRSDNEGADAIKQAVGAILGLPVDYYLLVNLDGFREIVEAMGGVTVNVNEPVAIEGNTDAGIPPVGYLEPGPDQHLDGYHALWFARGRWGSDDYARMERQRCLVDALVAQADPLTLLRRYQALAAGAQRILRTDVPRKLLPAFVGLAPRVKQAGMRSVVFRSSAEFNPADPDFDLVRSRVSSALEPRQGRRDRGGAAATPAVDGCAYHPTS